jgi:hypothetical protein
MKAAQFWNTNNVKSFKGYDVVNGEVQLSDSEYIDLLDEVYGDVKIGSLTYSAGSVLEAVDPIAFNCGKGEEESVHQADLEEQLENEDDNDIEFIEELDEDEEVSEYDEGYEAFNNGEDLTNEHSDDFAAGWHDAKSNKEYADNNPM